VRVAWVKFLRNNKRVALKINREKDEGRAKGGCLFGNEGKTALGAERRLVSLEPGVTVSSHQLPVGC